jgi:ElaB/YqjD/DUF883 family membrane-anchored ribosome-binding protein
MSVDLERNGRPTDNQLTNNNKETAVAQVSPYNNLRDHPKALSETATDLGERAWEQTTAAAESAGEIIKQHPIATVAVVAGLAFAVGALWKMGHGRQQTVAESLLNRLSDLQRELPRRWRL